MKYPSREYDELVRKNMHKVTHLSESECAKEIEAIIPNYQAHEFGCACLECLTAAPQMQEMVAPKKRRGRPPGVKNKPKAK